MIDQSNRRRTLTPSSAQRSRPPQGSRPPGPLILGHRGASARAPENSLEAFERAVADGADGAEFDVRLCASGEVVVFHDRDLTRLGGSAERIADLPWSDLRARKLLSGARVPLLSEVLDVLEPVALMNIEIKVDRRFDASVTPLTHAIRHVLHAAPPGLTERVVVSSFSGFALSRFHRDCPDIRIGYLLEAGLGWRLRQRVLPGVLHADAIHPAHALCDRDKVARWHDRGFAVNVWTVDDAPRIRALAAMGVDAIIANDPAAARAALA